MNKDYFDKDATSLKNKKLFLLDMDGTIYQEDRLFDGVIDFLKDIKKNNGRYVFITNNSSKSVLDYIKKIQSFGIEADKENFYTSTQATIAYLKDKYPNALVYAQGTQSFIKELRDEGVKITTQNVPGIEVVLVGFDNELTMEKLRTTCEILTLNDVAYIATNPDLVCPVSFGYVPDCGSMCYGIYNATKKSPIYIGKPEPTMINYVIKKFNYEKMDAIVFGDRLYTDIASGMNAGVDTILVLSGEATLTDYAKSEVKPTFVFNNINEVYKIIYEK